jgi:hypothetical protein
MKPETIAFVQDYNSGNYSTAEMKVRHHLKTDSDVYMIVTQLRAKGLISKVRSRKVRQLIHNGGSRHAAALKLTAPMKPRVKMYRRVSFGDGFSIHVKRNTEAKLVISENGNVTVVKP